MYSSGAFLYDKHSTHTVSYIETCLTIMILFVVSTPNLMLQLACLLLTMQPGSMLGSSVTPASVFILSVCDFCSLFIQTNCSDRFSHWFGIWEYKLVLISL